MLGVTLVDLFDKAVNHYGSRVAFKDEERSLTYRELNTEVNKMARVLQNHHVKHGDAVSVWLKNSIDYVIVDLALIKVGAIRVLLNTFLSNDDVAYRINDSRSKLIICEEGYRGNMASLRGEISEDSVILTNGGADATNFKQLMEKESDSPVQVTVSEEDLTMIMYTGGTTGRSKGVKHTHKSVIAVMYSEIVEMGVDRGVTMLHVAPLPHAAGFLIFPGLVRGGTQIIHDGFNAKSFCKTVEKEKVNFSFLVPTMIYNILDLSDRDTYDFSSLRRIIYGAAPMAPNRIREAMSLFGNVLVQIYSQAEVANQTTVLTIDDHVYALENDESILSSCGRCIVMSQVKIVNENGETCEPNEVGEIVTKGPHMMLGYWDMEEETKETIRDGWLYTGDVAYMDEDGYVYLVDRKNDVIISGGFNVYTTAVEKVLFEHPSVQQATVIGVPDQQWGEAIKAYIVPDGTNINVDEIIEYCKGKLARYEVPKDIEVIDELPLTAYGKIDKKLLRAPYWEGVGRQVN